jgi:phosphatidylserine decarboxylase
VLAGLVPVLATNERVVLLCRTRSGPLWLVFVGALNVGRLRVVGAPPRVDGPLSPPKPFARGAELGRFELGSTVVVVAPAGTVEPTGATRPGDSVRLGTALGRLL